MRIKATRASYGDFGHIARNRILDDVPTDHARELIEKGLFTEVQGSADAPADAEPKSKRGKKPAANESTQPE